MAVKFYGDQFVILGGDAKTGTTLPLTLLDNHPDLIVFPEELRFFHSGVEKGTAEEGLKRFLNDNNTQQLKNKDAFFDDSDYMAHGGTGFGKRDYSHFNYDLFEKRILEGVEDASTTFDRFIVIVNAFKTAAQFDIKSPAIFVCKSPHNEFFVEKWLEILPKDSKFVISTRIPTEHYITKRKVAKIASSAILSPIQYSNNIMDRVNTYWEKMPKDRRYIVDYDTLLTETEKVMRGVCNFIGVPFHTNVLSPTKMGIPWSGNSVRGQVSDIVFKNPHKALDELSEKEIFEIEQTCVNLYQRMGWERLSEENSKRKFGLFFRNAIPKATIRSRKVIARFLPPFLKKTLKSVFGVSRA